MNNQAETNKKKNTFTQGENKRFNYDEYIFIYEINIINIFVDY